MVLIMSVSFVTHFFGAEWDLLYELTDACHMVFSPSSRRMKIAIAHLVHNTKFLFSSFLALPCAPRAGVSLFTIVWCSSAPWTSLQNMWFMRKILLKIYLQLICCEISVAPENTERRRSEFEGKRKKRKMFIFSVSKWMSFGLHRCIIKQPSDLMRFNVPTTAAGENKFF